MAAPQPHQLYLQRRGYVPPDPASLTAQEIDLLDRYCFWMDALAGGVIAPTTPEQEHFVRAARGEAAPETAFERVWAKVAAQQVCDVPLGVPARPSDATPMEQPETKLAR